MGCKYPKESRSYHFCIGCSDKKFCADSTVSIPMPTVKQPKKDESDIEKAIKLLIDSGYSVAKLN